ncbi:EAL domain-containing protein [Novosphingobium sp. H3SJ31-1]|uniref:EAL domain-containing protein n=1 Tax=Novosphingobium album (ex Liu et al. 2023) TaxID=3031130 RepID=A0ABT5WPL8_9SPHN|nr:EAL domain-containing protein [Novosphingobium album (ex Liu et al. 2023)]
MHRLGQWPGFRLDLVRHDVPERDRQWYARCRLQQFELFPWISADIVRALIAIWCIRDTPAHLWAIAVAALIVISTGEAIIGHRFRTVEKDALRRLDTVRVFLFVRALVWAYVIWVAVRHADAASIGPIMFFATIAVLFDVLSTISLPLVGLAANMIVVLGMAIGLMALPGIDRGQIAFMTVLFLLGIHYALFNLHYLFATRRLRTRNLKVANETIQLLLNQYDEHGSDWLVELDTEGRLLRPSQRLCEVLGIAAEQLEGVHAADLFEHGPELANMLAVARSLSRFRDHTVPIRIDGERRWWSISGCATFGPDGEHTGYRGFVQDITERRAAEQRVRTMATRDNLTGLVNRGVFTTRLDALFAGGSEPPRCAILYIDLDGFKLVNDSLGHGMGDMVLIEAAQRIAALTMPGDTVARIGGDEFAVLVESPDCVARVMDFARRLVTALATPARIDGRSIPVGASIGVAVAPDHGAIGDALLRAADLALYEAKLTGRGRCIEYHPELLAERQDRRNLEMDLRHAIERDEFHLEYQPLYHIESRRITGYEALLRWQHPTRGLVPPEIFIPLAEKSELIIHIGDWVLREALAQAATWNENLTIAVNVSPAQMRGEMLLGQIIGALATSGVSPGRLEIEITETLLMHECDMHLRTLHRLRAHGVRIALDDFGTGYSSLNYLRRFPFDKLKIDQSFVQDLPVNAESRAIVDIVLTLARRFRMETIAEGVEEEAQLTTLAEMGCQQVQGYLIARPMPAHKIPAEHRRSRATAGRRLAGDGTVPPGKDGPSRIRSRK